jgi:hypothetical protein
MYRNRRQKVSIPPGFCRIIAALRLDAWIVAKKASSFLEAFFAKPPAFPFPGYSGGVYVFLILYSSPES